MTQRHGLSAVEAAIAWAHSKFSGDDDVFDHIEPVHRDALRATRGSHATWRTQDANEEDLSHILETTSTVRQDRLVTRLPEPWLKRLHIHQSDETHEEDEALGALVTYSMYDSLFHGAHRIPHRKDLLGAQEHTLDIGWLLENLSAAPLATSHVGAALLATLAQGAARREQARQAMLLPESAREAFVQRLSQPLEFSEEATLRLGEVFHWVRRHHPDWGDTLLHLGLSCWVCAAGPRHPRRLERLGQLWSRRWAGGADDPVAQYRAMHSIERGADAGRRATREAFSLELARALTTLIPDVRAILEVSS